MSPGAETEIVTVNAAAEGVVLERSSSELGNVIRSKEIQQLPLNGRNFTQLLIFVSRGNAGVDSAGLVNQHDGCRHQRNSGHKLLQAGVLRAAKPRDLLPDGRDREHGHSRRDLRIPADYRCHAGIQSAIAHGRRGVRDSHRRRGEHAVEVRYKPVPRISMGVRSQQHFRRPEHLQRLLLCGAVRTGHAQHDACCSGSLRSKPVRRLAWRSHLEKQDLLLWSLRRLAIQQAGSLPGIGADYC